MSKKYIKSAYAPPHPGKIFRDGFINEYNVPLITIAKVLGITRQHLNKILNGEQRFTNNIIMNISILTGDSFETWANLQRNHDAYFFNKDKLQSKYAEKLKELSQYIVLNSEENNERRTNDGFRELVTETSKLVKSMNNKNKSKK